MFPLQKTNTGEKLSLRLRNQHNGDTALLEKCSRGGISDVAVSAWWSVQHCSWNQMYFVTWHKVMTSSP